MTAFRIDAPSVAVARTLQAIVNAAGGQVDDAAPYHLHHTPEALLLLQGDTELQRLPLPVHPHALLPLLAPLCNPTQHPLAQGWCFDITARQLQRADTIHSLTEKETALLAALLAAYPAPCPRDALLRDVWGVQAAVETHTLETHIYRLRHKLAELTPKPCDIVTTDSAYLLTLEPTA